MFKTNKITVLSKLSLGSTYDFGGKQKLKSPILKASQFRNYGPLRTKKELLEDKLSDVKYSVRQNGRGTKNWKKTTFRLLTEVRQLRNMLRKKNKENSIKESKNRVGSKSLSNRRRGRERKKNIEEASLKDVVKVKKHKKKLSRRNKIGLGTAGRRKKHSYFLKRKSRIKVKTKVTVQSKELMMAENPREKLNSKIKTRGERAKYAKSLYKNGKVTKPNKKKLSRRAYTARRRKKLSDLLKRKRKMKVRAKVGVQSKELVEAEKPREKLRSNIRTKGERTKYGKSLYKSGKVKKSSKELNSIRRRRGETKRRRRLIKRPILTQSDEKLNIAKLKKRRHKGKGMKAKIEIVKKRRRRVKNRVRKQRSRHRRSRSLFKRRPFKTGSCKKRSKRVVEKESVAASSEPKELKKENRTGKIRSKKPFMTRKRMGRNASTMKDTAKKHEERISITQKPSEIFVKPSATVSQSKRSTKNEDLDKFKQDVHDKNIHDKINVEKHDIQNGKGKKDGKKNKKSNTQLLGVTSKPSMSSTREIPAKNTKKAKFVNEGLVEKELHKEENNQTKNEYNNTSDVEDQITKSSKSFINWSDNKYNENVIRIGFNSKTTDKSVQNNTKQTSASTKKSEKGLPGNVATIFQGESQAAARHSEKLKVKEVRSAIGLVTPRHTESGDPKPAAEDTILSRLPGKDLKLKNRKFIKSGDTEDRKGFAIKSQSSLTAQRRSTKKKSIKSKSPTVATQKIKVKLKQMKKSSTSFINWSENKYNENVIRIGFNSKATNKAVQSNTKQTSAITKKSEKELSGNVSIIFQGEIQAGPRHYESLKVKDVGSAKGLVTPKHTESGDPKPTAEDTIPSRLSSKDEELKNRKLIESGDTEDRKRFTIESQSSVTAQRHPTKKISVKSNSSTVVTEKLQDNIKSISTVRSSNEGSSDFRPENRGMKSENYENTKVRVGFGKPLTQSRKSHSKLQWGDVKSLHIPSRKSIRALGILENQTSEQFRRSFAKGTILTPNKLALFKSSEIVRYSKALEKQIKRTRPFRRRQIEERKLTLGVLHRDSLEIIGRTLTLKAAEREGNKISLKLEKEQTTGLVKFDLGRNLIIHLPEDHLETYTRGDCIPAATMSIMELRHMPDEALIHADFNKAIDEVRKEYGLRVIEAVFTPSPSTITVARDLEDAKSFNAMQIRERLRYVNQRQTALGLSNKKRKPEMITPGAELITLYKVPWKENDTWSVASTQMDPIKALKNELEYRQSLMKTGQVSEKPKKKKIKKALKKKLDKAGGDLTYSKKKESKGSTICPPCGKPFCKSAYYEKIEREAQRCFTPVHTKENYFII